MANDYTANPNSEALFKKLTSKPKVTKYHCEVRRGDSWQSYRDDQKFNHPDAANRLANRLMDRYGEDAVRVVPVEVEREAA
jgi:hypothetical protein